MKKILAFATISVLLLGIGFSPVAAHDNNNCNHTENTANDGSGNHTDPSCTVEPIIVYVDRIVYVDKIVEKIVYKDREVIKEVVKEVPGPTIYVDRIVNVPGPTIYRDREVIKYVDRVVEVPVEVIKYVEVVPNPDEVIIKESTTPLAALENCSFCDVLDQNNGWLWLLGGCLLLWWLPLLLLIALLFRKIKQS